MIAEVIEKGDATFTVKYSAENGMEAMLIGAMATATSEKGIYLNASGHNLHVGSFMIPVIASLDQTWSPK